MSSPFRHARFSKENTKFKAVLTPILAKVAKASTVLPLSRVLW